MPGRHRTLRHDSLRAVGITDNLTNEGCIEVAMHGGALEREKQPALRPTQR